MGEGKVSDLENWKIEKPFPMDGTHNFRDLGGYPTKSGRTRKGCFYRSDALNQLSEKDQRWMREKGITCILDLRSRREMEASPDRVGDGFEYYAVSMSDRMKDELDQERFPDSLAKLYIQILESQQEEVCQVMEILAKRDGKPAVFHCAVGKDRTGVIAMLLLLLAGVPREVILQDYAVSAQNMREAFGRQRQMLRKAGWDVPEILFESPEEEMGQTVDYLIQKWEGAEAYLRACGVTENAVCRLKKHLVEG